MPYLDKYMFETSEKRETWLTRNGYKTTHSILVNVNLSEDELGYYVECIKEKQGYYSDNYLSRYSKNGY